MKSGLILITNKLEIGNIGGREQLCSLNRNILKDIYKDKFYLAEIIKSPPVSFCEKFAAFKGYIDGLNKDTVSRIIKEIRENNINQVFIDGSNFGELSRALKGLAPKVKIYTFFHNVEAKFFWRSFRCAPSIHALSVFLANFLAEKKSIKHSDQIICLNERDSSLLEKWYGRRSNHVAPMSIADKFVGEKFINMASQRFVLFVGGDFYANISGIQWYVDNVSDFVDMHTYIVGRSMEKFKAKLEINDKVRVIGEVNNLEQWYLNSYLVIAPIFDGSGMKTKVAEALMFGKKIVGTEEAFTGYEDIANRIGWLCESAEQFVNAIKTAQNVITLNFDPSLRAIYEEKYSFSASKARFARILRSQ